MEAHHIATISEELNLDTDGIRSVGQLLENDATVPFIARYRKEATGGLDEVQITAIRDRMQQLVELDARRSAILGSLFQNGHLTDELKERVAEAATLAALEDVYLPYRPKRRTRGMAAREKGLEPLARTLFSQEGSDPEESSAAFINPELGVETIEDALGGARDIIAEWVNEDADARSRLRRLFEEEAGFVSRVAAGMEEEGAKYKDYFDWREPARTAPSHRILAMRRGEREDVLNLSLVPPEGKAIDILDRIFVKASSADGEQVKAALRDSYKRLLSRSLETEARLATKMRAEKDAIQIFADNLRQLLLSPPLGAKRVMGIDPGLRTGCKVVCLDEQSKLIHCNTTIYPHGSADMRLAATEAVKDLCSRFRIEAIAIGNGTAGRETERFIREIPLDSYMVALVNESGASVYSASEGAREEFPDLDLTVRGAVSIGRRLMDPLSELVKIDPKSIGVGQYQHDVDQNRLRQALDDTVISCVNHVGVDVNRASKQLLTYVSGLGPQLAENIVSFRDKNGPYKSREDLKEVKRLGPKAFEQSAGFLRIVDGGNPLDRSAVHPESYSIVDTMAADLNCSVSELIADPTARSRIDPARFVTDTVGLPTLADILDELSKPGRDPRATYESFSFDSGIAAIEDLQTGMRLPGIVTNITAFGAFVDIGIHQDGLVHISQLADRFVKHPADIVKVHQKVVVTVLDIDVERKRISLSMKSDANPDAARDRNAPAVKSPSKGRKPARKTRPFNNAFAEAFKKR